MTDQASNDRQAELLPGVRPLPTGPRRRGRADTLVEKLGFHDPDRGTPLHDLACAYLSEHAEAIATAHLARAPMRLPSHPPILPEGCDLYAYRAEIQDGLYSAGFAHHAGQYPPAKVVDPGTVDVCEPSAATEVPLMKGERQYKTIVGFLDVVITYDAIRTDCQMTVARREPGPPEPCKHCQGRGTLPATNFQRCRECTGLAPGPCWRCGGTGYAAPEIGATQPCYNCRHTGSVPTWQWGRAQVALKPQEVSRLIVLEVKIGRVTLGEVLRQFALYREYADALYRQYEIRPSAWWLVTPYPLSAADLALLEQANVTHFALGEKFRTWCAAQQTPAESPEL